MSGFDENPFGEPTTDNPFAVSTYTLLYIQIVQYGLCSLLLRFRILLYSRLQEMPTLRYVLKITIPSITRRHKIKGLYDTDTNFTLT